MGSLPSPPRPQDPTAPANPNLTPNPTVYCAFRVKEPVPGTPVSIRIHAYHPSNNSWNFVTSIPFLMENHGLKDFAMVCLGQSIYIIGGRSFEQQIGQPNNPVNELDAQVLVSVHRYDVLPGIWSTCAPLTIPRYDFACTVCEGKIYVAGGKSTPASPTGLASTESYDPAVDAWTLLPSMSTCRYKCVGVTWKGKIHVVGGFALRVGSGAKPLNFTPERSSAEVFDTRTGAWGLVSGMWQLDVPPNQIVEVDGKLLSSGDCLKVWKGHIESYDGDQNIWNEVEGSGFCDLDGSGLYLTIAPIGAYLYFLAGYQVDGETPRTKSIVHRFDTLAIGNAWVSFEPVEEDGERLLVSHCCVAQLS